MKIRLIFIASIMVALDSCVSYEHTLDSSEYEAEMKLIEKSHRFSQTESCDLALSQKVQSQMEQGMSPEKRQKIESANWIKTPTYLEVNKYVKRKHGEKATFANVVWDIKHIRFLGLHHERYVGVTYDVYIPSE